MFFLIYHGGHLVERLDFAILPFDLAREYERGISLVAALGHAQVAGRKENSCPLPNQELVQL
jgi:hypothetical protein